MKSAMRACRLIPALLLAGGACAAHAACLPPDAGRRMTPSTPAAPEVALKFDPAVIVIGRPFTLHIRLCPAAGIDVTSLGIDASMPAHRHGMNYRPRINARGEGELEASGFLFHMPGRWVIEMSVGGPAQPHRLTLDVEVK